MTYSEFKDVLLKTALEKGCDAAEVYAVDTDRFFVEVMEGDVDSYSVSKSISLALRVTVNGRDGYAYTMLLDEAESFIMRAMENAGACQTGECKPMQQMCEYKAVELPEAPLLNMTAAERIAFAKELEKQVLAADKRCIRVAENQVEVIQTTTHIANTLGLDASRQAVYAQCSTEPVLQNGTQLQKGRAARSGKAVFEIEACAKAAVADAARKFDARIIPSGEYPVVLEKGAAAEVLNGFFTVFSAERAQKGLSLLRGKEGEQVAASCVSITDDPLLAFNPRAFDDEGVPSVRTTVIENGTLKSMLYDLDSARKAGCCSTSNGGRDSAMSPVEIMPSNFYILPGAATYGQLLENLGDGVIIRDLSGLHVGMDPVSGGFSLLAGGWLRKNGQLYPVEQITVAGNFFTMLQEIEEVGNDLHLGAPRKAVVGSPSLRLKRLRIAGK